MSVELTVEQQRALDSQRDWPPHLVDPRTRSEYVLLPADDYQRMCELLEEGRTRQKISRVAGRNAAGRL